MVSNNVSTCPACNGRLKERGYVDRTVKGKRGIVRRVKIRKLICDNCGTTHRELPTYLAPYKHYELDIITGIVDGIITSGDMDYEDYPCESTIKEWRKSQKIHLI